MMETAIIYRVIVKVSYRQAHFDFDSADQACSFMRIAAEHVVGSDDDDVKVKLRMEIINPAEESEDDD